MATTALSTVEDQDACLAAGMDAFITKPMTPEKLRAVLAGSNGILPPAAKGPRSAPPAPGEPDIDLGMIRRLSDGSPGGLDRELARFAGSLDEAPCAGSPMPAGPAPRARLSSAAHRVLSLARMVGASRLSDAAADLQEFASAYTDSEAAEQVGLLERTPPPSSWRWPAEAARWRLPRSPASGPATRRARVRQLSLGLRNSLCSFFS